MATMYSIIKGAIPYYLEGGLGLMGHVSCLMSMNFFASFLPYLKNAKFI